MTAGANQLTAHATNRDESGPTTPMLQFRAWVDAFERLGYPMAQLLPELGQGTIDLDDPDASVPCPVICALFERTQCARPLKNIWARLGAETPIGAFKLLDYLILTADTVGGAYKQFVRYARLVSAPFVVDIREGEDPIRMVHLMDASVAPASVEYSVALASRFLREEAESSTSFAHVSFVHQPDDVAELERLLGCEVRPQASWAGAAMTRDAWQIPLKRRDPVLRGLLETQADAITPRVSAAGTLRLDVRRAIASRLSRSETAIEIVARDLGLSSRTLQRRLSASGLSYQELFDGVRREAAEKHIEDPSLAIGEVAYLAGYSEPAAFHRAFKRWTGVTPQTFRRRLRDNGKRPSP